MATHVYHWKHGWIPLDHAAALSKAKGDHKAASKMLEDAKSPGAGIHSREHVAKAAVGLGHISNPEHRAAALSEVHAAADRHNAHDVLPAAMQKPGGTGGPTGALWRVKAHEVQAGDTLHVPSAMGGSTKRYRIDKTYGPKSDGGVNIDATNLDTGAKHELTLQGDKKHDIAKRRSTLPEHTDQTGLPEGYSVKRDVIDGYGPVSTFSVHGPNGERVAHAVHGETAARNAATNHHARAQAAEVDRKARQERIAADKAAKAAAHDKVVADGRAAYAKPDTVDVADQVATNHLVERMHNSGASMSPGELSKIAGSSHVAQHHRDRAQGHLNDQALKRVQFMQGANDARAVNARLIDARQSMPAGPMRDALIHALEQHLANVGGGSSSSPKAWTSPRGMHVPLKDVNEAHLAALYAAETNDADPGAFTRAFDQANTATRHAFKAGYRNPRVSDRGTLHH